MLVLSKTKREAWDGGGGRTALFLAIESFYFSQNGLDIFPFVLISFVQGVASDLRTWAGFILAGTVQ